MVIKKTHSNRKQKLFLKKASSQKYTDPTDVHKKQYKSFKNVER